MDHEFEAPVEASEPQAVAPIGIARTIGLIALFYVFFGICGGVLMILGYGFATAPGLLVPQVIPWLLVIALAWRHARRTGLGAPPVTNGPNGAWPALVIASFGAAVVLVQVVSFVPMPEQVLEQMKELRHIGLVPRFIHAVLVAPIAEEVFFRGFVLTGFLARYPVRKAVWASALLFAVSHMNPWQFILALPLGLAFAWLVMRTGSLGPSIVGHAVVNLTGQLIIPWLMQRMGYASEEIRALDLLPWPILLAGAILCVGGAVWLLRAIAERAPAPIVREQEEG